MQKLENIDWHSISIEHTLKHLHTNENGLSSKHVKQRKKIYGYNRLKPPKRRSLLVRFLIQFHNILIYILLVATSITLLLRHWIDATVIIAVVFLNALVGCIQEGKAERALDAIKEMLSPMASVIRNGKTPYYRS